MPKRKLHAYASDNDDGHTRITTGEGIVVSGGSKESHYLMVERSLKIKEKLKAHGGIDGCSRDRFINTVAEVISNE